MPKNTLAASSEGSGIEVITIKEKGIRKYSVVLVWGNNTQSVTITNCVYLSVESPLTDMQLGFTTEPFGKDMKVKCHRPTMLFISYSGRNPVANTYRIDEGILRSIRGDLGKVSASTKDGVTLKKFNELVKRIEAR